MADARASTVPRAEPVAMPVQPRSPSPQPPSPSPVPDLTAITGKWDDLVEKLRAEKPMLASALGHSSPLTISASGVLTIGLDEQNDIFAHSINGAKNELLAALRGWFPGLERVELRRDEGAPAAPPKRLTDDDIRAARIASLRKRDPLLSAAIDALDLDVTD